MPPPLNKWFVRILNNKNNAINSMRYRFFLLAIFLQSHLMFGVYSNEELEELHHEYECQKFHKSPEKS